MSLSLAPGVAAGVVDPRRHRERPRGRPFGRGERVSRPPSSRARSSAAPPRMPSAAHTATSPRSARPSPRRPSAGAGPRRGRGGHPHLLHPVLVPRPGGSSRPRPRRSCPGSRMPRSGAAWEDAYAGETFVQVLPEGQHPRTADVIGANTASWPVDRSRGRSRRRDRRRRQPREGDGGRRDPVHEPRAGPPGGPRPDRERSGPECCPLERCRRRDRPEGSKRRVSPRDSSRAARPTSRSSSTWGPARRGRPCSRPTARKANPILWSEQAIRDGAVEAIVLNSGGANCFTGAFGFQTTHQTGRRPRRSSG